MTACRSSYLIDETLKYKAHNCWAIGCCQVEEDTLCFASDRVSLRKFTVVLLWNMCLAGATDFVEATVFPLGTSSSSRVLSPAFAVSEVGKFER